MSKVNPQTRVEQTVAASDTKTKKKAKTDINVWEKYSNAKDDAIVTKNENFAYTSPQGKSYTGKLTVFKDGTCYFESKLEDGTPFLLEFKNQDELQKNKIRKQINNPNDNAKIQTLTYHYDIWGNKSHVDITDSNDRLTKKITYNNKGKVTKQQIYDSETGKVKQTVKHEYDKKAHTETRTVLDKDNNLESTVSVQYDNDDKTVKNIVVKDKNGNVKAEKEYQDGKIKTEKVYQDGKVVSEKEFENGNVVKITSYKDDVKVVQQVNDAETIKITQYQNDEIKTEIIKWKDTNVIKDRWDYKNGEKTHTISSDIDLDFKPSRQGSAQGDCYLLSVINGMIGAEGGTDALKELIDVTENNGKKEYKVTLPGAVMLKNGLQDDSDIDPNKNYISGTYTFTQEELNAILKQAGKKYSIGNANVILLEAAFERFREEVSKTIKENNVTKLDYTVAGKNRIEFKEDNILYGGLSYDAAFMLTGQQSYVYMKTREYALSTEDLVQGNFSVVKKQKPDSMEKAAPTIVAEDIAASDKKLDEYLDKVRKDFEDGRIDNIVTAGFATIDKNGKKSGHAFTVAGIDENTITLVNPWFPDKTLTMSIEDFKKCVSQFAISSKPAKESVRPQEAAHQETNGNDEVVDDDSEDSVDESNDSFDVITNNNGSLYYSKTNNQKVFAQKDANGNFRTMPLQGETFRDTMERLGISRELLGDNYDRAEQMFRDANSHRSKWFLVGEMDIIIPKELAELIEFEQNIHNCVMDPDEQVADWKRRVGLD